MKIRIYTIIAFLCLVTLGYGQRRQLQEARAIIKSGKGFANAEKMMVALLKDSANLNNMRIYDMWLQSVEKQYDQVNEQMYKKQVVDTASLFGLTQRIFKIAERLDSIDMRPDKKGRVAPEYRKDKKSQYVTYQDEKPYLYSEAQPGYKVDVYLVDSRSGSKSYLYTDEYSPKRAVYYQGVKTR